MATTWSKTGSRSVKAVCTTGTENAPSTPAKASQTVAFSTAVAGNTVTVRGMTFTAIGATATPANTQEFSVGASNTACGDNFAAAVNANSSILGLTASNSSGTVTLTASEYGTGPNAWTLAKVGAPITLGGSVLANGVDIVGVPLEDVGSISIRAQAATAGQTIAGGSLVCYVLDERSTRYLKYPDGDLSPGAAYQGFAWATSVIAPFSYVAWLPSGVTISSGNLDLYIDAAEPDNRPTSGQVL